MPSKAARRAAWRIFRYDLSLQMLLRGSVNTRPPAMSLRAGPHRGTTAGLTAETARHPHRPGSEGAGTGPAWKWRGCLSR